MIKREIPKNIEAEEAVLGSILINQETIYGVSELLDIEDFYRKADIFSILIPRFISSLNFLIA